MKKLSVAMFFLGWVILFLGAGIILPLFLSSPGTITAVHIFYWLGFSGLSFGGAVVGHYLTT